MKLPMVVERKSGDIFFGRYESAKLGHFAKISSVRTSFQVVPSIHFTPLIGRDKKMNLKNESIIQSGYGTRTYVQRVLCSLSPLLTYYITVLVL